MVHGWNDDPSRGWLGWLGGHLNERGYDVAAPHFDMKSPHRLDVWLVELTQLLTAAKPGTILVAHSLGCWLTLRGLESLTGSRAFSHMYLVAGFYDAPQPAAEKYFSPEPDWSKVIEQVSRRTCIYSDNDTIVTPDRTRRLAHKLDAELLCIPERGHFLGSRGMETFPELLSLIIAS